MPSEDLLIKITKCEELTKASSTCEEIIKNYGKGNPKPEYNPSSSEYQVPEPWDGDIDNSKYLFIGSNPAYDSDEKFVYPVTPENETIDFFANRLIKKGWAGIRRSKTTKTPYWYNVCKWVHLIKIAEESKRCKDVDIKKVIEEFKEKQDPYLKEICMTEVVHCKSNNCYGLNNNGCNCIENCFNKYFRRILECFVNNNCYDIKYIVVCIGVSKSGWKKDLIDKTYDFIEDYIKDKSNIKLLILPHPSNANKDKDIYVSICDQL